VSNDKVQVCFAHDDLPNRTQEYLGGEHWQAVPEPILKAP
jgi:hypothetical protein